MDIIKQIEEIKQLAKEKKLTALKIKGEDSYGEGGFFPGIIVSEPNYAGSTIEGRLPHFMRILWKDCETIFVKIVLRLPEINPAKYSIKTLNELKVLIVLFAGYTRKNIK